MTPLTPVIDYGGWWAKRDDLACASDREEYPGGSKVRQYAAMIAASPAEAPMIVGCSADSAMQIYVAAAARQSGRLGIVYTARRQERTQATTYAAKYAEVVEVAPGYLSQCRSAARSRGKDMGAVVRWDAAGAIEDAAAQVENLPAGVRRIVIPTGSGLTASGVLVGLCRAGRYDVGVLCLAVSTMASAVDIWDKALALLPEQPDLPRLSLRRAPQAYGEPVFAVLPDDALLDPYYAAKARGEVTAGDCLWVPGVRPRVTMPDEIRREADRLHAVA